MLHVGRKCLQDGKKEEGSAGGIYSRRQRTPASKTGRVTCREQQVNGLIKGSTVK